MNQFDVIIIGAGLSGICAAHHLNHKVKQRSYAILEMRDNIGGTWDLFRYPGIRSDSNMNTYSFPFRPWTSTQTMADGETILQYLKDTVEEEGIDKKIHFQRKLVKANWSTEDAQWILNVEDSKTGEAIEYRCNFLLMCSGYYDYDKGYTPDFKGFDEFKGQIIHPQKWPEDIDYSGKKVVVIGSGATAVTLIPSMADQVEKITMLQRSPTYIVSEPGVKPIGKMIKRVFGGKLGFKIIRRIQIVLELFVLTLSRRLPNLTRRLLLAGVKKELGKDYDIDTHFSPSYKPWDQRICMVPDGDLFKAIKSGKAEVVTDHIDRFTEKGILLKSGKDLEADIIVTATGLNLKWMQLDMTIDGKPKKPGELVYFRGTMFDEVPNLVMVVGYTTMSWTLRANLVCEYITRVLNHMDAKDKKIVVPNMADRSQEIGSFVDLNSGYFMRAMDSLPKQGEKKPWKVNTNYWADYRMLRYASMTHPELDYK